MCVPCLGIHQRQTPTFYAKQADRAGTSKKETRHGLLEGTRTVQTSFHATEPETPGKNTENDRIIFCQEQGFPLKTFYNEKLF